MTEKSLRRRVMTALAKLVLLCLRFLPTFSARQAMAAVFRWGDLIRAVDSSPGGRAAIARICSYFLRTTDVTPERLLAAFETVLRRRECSIMSTAQKLLAKGEARGEARGEVRGEARGVVKGAARGRAELLLRLLVARFGEVPARTQARVQRATAAEIDRWAVAVLDAATMTDVFGKRARARRATRAS